MNIIYLHQYFKTPSSFGGVRSYEMAKRLVIRGHKVSVITGRDFGKSIYSETNGVSNIDKIKVYWLDVFYSQKYSYFKRVFSFIKFSCIATIKTLKIKGDIIYATSTPLTIVIPAIIASKIKGIPFIFEIRDEWPAIPIGLGILKNPILCFLAKKLESYALRKSSSIVVLSPGMKAGLVNRGICHKKIAIITNASDVDFLKMSS